MLKHEIMSHSVAAVFCYFNVNLEFVMVLLYKKMDNKEVLLKFTVL